MEGDSIVEHFPCEKSHVIWYFIDYDGVVTYQVIDQWKHAIRIEVPWVYIVWLYVLNNKYW